MCAESGDSGVGNSEGATTYSGPRSLLPELLKAPRLMASGLRGFDESIFGADELNEMIIGEKKMAAPATLASAAVRRRLAGVQNDIPG